jgi:hypothetical protein
MTFNKYNSIGEDAAGRGWYISMDEEGCTYLHSDGKVKEGVYGQIGRYSSDAFWPSKEEAEKFYNSWIKND